MSDSADASRRNTRGCRRHRVSTEPRRGSRVRLSGTSEMSEREVWRFEREREARPVLVLAGRVAELVHVLHGAPRHAPRRVGEVAGRAARRRGDGRLRARAEGVEGLGCAASRGLQWFRAGNCLGGRVPRRTASRPSSAAAPGSSEPSLCCSSSDSARARFAAFFFPLAAVASFFFFSVSLCCSSELSLSCETHACAARPVSSIPAAAMSNGEEPMCPDVASPHRKRPDSLPARRGAEEPLPRRQPRKAPA